MASFERSYHIYNYKLHISSNYYILLNMGTNFKVFGVNIQIMNLKINVFLFFM